MTERLQNYIDGAWRSSEAAGTLAVTNPATGETIAATPLSTTAELDSAVAAARRAFPDWRATPVPERARVLFRLRDLLVEHKEDLARLLTIEHGKVVAETRGEVQRGIENVEHTCGAPTLMMGATVEDIAPGIDSVSVRQPLGVFGVIELLYGPLVVALVLTLAAHYRYTRLVR